jgi:NDP-sugar pyrophosphorylase family protein
MDVIIPIAAEHPAFREAKYEQPKPLVSVNGVEMIRWATACLNGLVDESSYIFVILQSHVDEYDLDEALFDLYNEEVTIVTLDGMTEGAAETVLAAQDHISTEELIVLFGDQYVELSLGTAIQETAIDGLIPVFEASSPEWSYAATAPNGTVTEVAEKEVISSQATAGLYYFRDGIDFVRAAQSMIAKDIRTDGLFYVCPVYNELIQMSRRIETVHVERMETLGTPSAVEAFDLQFNEVVGDR